MLTLQNNSIFVVKNQDLTLLTADIGLKGKSTPICEHFLLNVLSISLKRLRKKM